MNPSDKSEPTPELLTLTSALLQEPLQEADPKADMILLFLVAGFTIVGSLLGACVATYFLNPSLGVAHTTISTLVCVAVGGGGGCGLALVLLGARGLVRWERRHNN